MAEVRWTEEQLAAIRSERDTLLTASAGTGKTTTVVGKILWALGIGHGRSPDGEAVVPAAEPCSLTEVVAITFTEKAAHDLQRKLREALEESPRGRELRWHLAAASIGTIHSFCAALLREHALRLGIDPTFRVLDADEAWTAQDELIREIVMDALAAGHTGVRDLLRTLQLRGFQFQGGLVDHVRDAMRDLRWRPDRYLGWPRDGAGAGGSSALRNSDDAADGDAADGDALRATATLIELATEARDRWGDWLDDENARDFDALVLETRALLQAADGAAALARIRARTRLLIVDEFQDTDFAQRDIVFAIGGHEHTQLFLVGDPKQSIYRFRGADISVWSDVREQIERDGAALTLSRNFRCVPEVIEFVNAAMREAIDGTGAAIAAESPGSRVAYAPLVAARTADATTRVEWLCADEEDVAPGRQAGAEQLTARIAELVGSRIPVTDPGSGRERPCEYSDVAVLYRSRPGLEHYENALARAGIPYWLAVAPHLGQRLEILDVINALRLIRNPRDDLRAFGFLRSPFVGLRDEVIARMRLERPHRSLLDGAARALEEPAWFPAPEHDRVADLERGALRAGLDALADLRALASRLPLDELVEELLDRTGYRLHLQLAEHAEEALANLQSFRRFCEGHRDADLETFLEIWERFTSRDPGIPQAPLYSDQDRVVTLSTVHAAKGLEWPVVFLVGVDKPIWRDPGSTYLSDRDLGPVLCARKADRGPRTDRIIEREELEARAEEARLLYVATTRARDRLILVGRRDKQRSYGAWLEPASRDGAVRLDAAAPPELRPRPRRRPRLQWLDRLEERSPPALVAPVPEPIPRFVVSATELMMRNQDPEAAELRFTHGVLSRRELAPAPTGGIIPATVRGTVIHGVLERIREAAELATILEETIGGLDDPELEGALAPGGGLWRALEQEILRVVESPEWSGYVDGAHHRELPFVDLAEPRCWRIGAFDLYRPDSPKALIVDFKTHQIEADDAERVALDYRIQADVYRSAAECRSPTRVRLHFTGPNVVVDL